MTEGYSAFVGSEVNEITENIAKSLLDTYGLDSVRISEMKAGSTTITAKTSNGKTASCSVTVKPASYEKLDEITSFSVNPAD